MMFITEFMVMKCDIDKKSYISDYFK